MLLLFFYTKRGVEVLILPPLKKGTKLRNEQAGIITHASSVLRGLCTVDKNNIGAPKMRNKLDALIFFFNIAKAISYPFLFAIAFKSYVD